MVATRDYSASIRTDAEGKTEPLDIPKCNCVYYELEGGSFICVRPSGTEPKLKIYYSVKAADASAAASLMELLKQSVEKLLK